MANLESTNTIKATPVAHVITADPGQSLAELSAPPQTVLIKDSKVDKTLDSYEKLIEKLFMERDPGKPRAYYIAECQDAARELKCDTPELIRLAFAELESSWSKVELNERGHVTNPEQIGKHFSAIYKIIEEKIDFWIITEQSQLSYLKGDLSPSLCEKVAKVVTHGEAVMITIAKDPPRKIAAEIQEISEKQLHGIMSLWTNDAVRAKLDMSPQLKNYLEYGTVKVRTTAENPEVKALVRDINTALEQTNSFESTHWLRVVKGIAHGEKQESLKGALKVCIPIVVCIKAAETYAPHLMHIAGGVLDDIFGAILPDVSQSMGQKEKPFSERLKHAMPVLLGGAASIPFSFGFAYLSSVLYQPAAPLSMRLLAGGAFAFACCAGTLGTSIAAFRKAWKGVDQASHDPRISESVGEMSWYQKAKLAFRESILDVPFRVGHTAIGVPVQLGLGLAAGAFGFFHSGLFVMVEGMAETILGAAAAYVYPKFVEAKKKHQLHTVAV